MIWLGLFYWFLFSAIFFIGIFWQFLRFSNPSWPKIEMLLTLKEIYDIVVCSILLGFFAALCGVGLTAMVIF